MEVESATVSIDVDESRPNTVRHATVDFVLAFLTVWLTSLAILAVFDDFVTLPVDGPTVRRAAALLALGTTYPFVSGLWSMARLLRFAQTAIVAGLAAGVVAALALLAIGGVPTDSLASELLQAVIVGLAVVVGAVDAVDRRLC